MRGRFRNIHRQEIRRLLYRHVDRLWDAAFGTYAAGIVFLVLGLWSLQAGGLIVFGIVSIALSVVFFCGYIVGSKRLHRRGLLPVWFNAADHLAIGVALLGFVLSPSIVRPFMGIVIGAFATLRMRRLWRPHWRVLFFREARTYFRDLARWQPNKRFKPTVLPPLRGDNTAA